eukprot:gnl/TRDRNA2_/TRDRNA2_136866_c0_seq1.p1 gnl/TRDRNA2_/TRDRNA2_136866_c0~~gnl/TRDRNA2_/TRDRNA2_136866_c0_seq1.p1  ORF type:complete len:101 (-),score=17.97 gnl/TRDRNA2_/TRDRNA2_136866_c0_seq1:55-318(-)
MVPYGLVVGIMSYWNVCFRGNKFTYIAASKAMALSERTNQNQSYGSMQKDVAIVLTIDKLNGKLKIVPPRKYADQVPAESEDEQVSS